MFIHYTFPKNNNEFRKRIINNKLNKLIRKNYYFDY